MSEIGALEIADLHKGYAANQVLCGVDLQVAPGSLSAVLGLSGCGKTTLLRVIAGFERAQSGRVELSGRVLDDERSYVPPERRGIGYVPQEGALFPHLDVRSNVAFGLPRGRRRGKAVSLLLEMVGLAALARRMPHELSGGEQQRVALARALAREPALLLLDEPFSSLDASLRASVREEVGALLRSHGTTTVLVTHDQEEALSLADTVAVLRDGKIVQHASPTEIYGAPADARLASFLGEANLIEASFEGGRAHTSLGSLDLHASTVGTTAVDTVAGGAAAAGGSSADGAADGRTETGGAAAGRAEGDAAATGRAAGGGAAAGGERGLVVVRPEQLRVTALEQESRGLAGTVEQCRYYGHDALISIRPEGWGTTASPLLARVHGDLALPAGTRVSVTATGVVSALDAADRADV